MRLVPGKTKELDLKISNLSCLIKVDGNVINFSTEAEHIGVTRTTTGGNLHHIVSRLTAHMASYLHCGAWNTTVLQGHCFVSRLDCLHLKSNHAKFQLNPIRNG